MAKRHQASSARSHHALAPEIHRGEREISLDEGLRHAAAEPRKPATTAVVVVHGIGQQLEFQTLDLVERGLRRVDPARDMETTLGGILKVGEKQVPRIELDLHCGSGDAQRTIPIHAFECYWASLTEGRITLRDVMGFLWRAGVDGLRNSAEDFKRWMFGDLKELPIRKETALWLNCAVVVLASLMALNAVIAAVGAARAFKAIAEPAARGSMLTPELLSDLSVGMAILLGSAVLGGLLAWGSRWMGFFWFVLWLVAVAGPALVAVAAFHRWPQWHESLSGFGIGWIAAIGLTALLVGLAFLLRGRQRRLAIAVRTTAVVGTVLLVGVFAAVCLHALDWSWPQWLYLVLWAVLLAASARVRTILVQYVGDVAVYVSPHRLDRFNDLRDEIKACVEKVVRAVLEARQGDDGTGDYRYERVFVVGHSLGSIAAYDVVNRRLLADHLADGKLRVADRLKLLLTFGSPLDKTAFIFRRQAKADAVTREVLAAALQPMIHDRVLRERIPWINVHSPKDIISGSLEFYDDPDWARGGLPKPPRIENVVDDDADVPLSAHNQYWDNDLIFQRLHDAICR